MVITIVPLVVAILGLVIYLVAKPDNPKLAEVGRIMFWTGLLVVLMVNAGKVVRF